MSKATFNPGKPAVTKTVEVFPAVPAKVILELTPEEATVVMGLLGVTTGSTAYEPYQALSDLAHAGKIKKPAFTKVYAAVERQGTHASPINSDKDFV